MKHVHIVQGRTGEYEDRQLWNVAAFTDMDAALKLVRKLNAETTKLGLADRHNFEVRPEALAKLRELDPQAQVDYTGTSYDFTSVELHD